MARIESRNLWNKGLNRFSDLNWKNCFASENDF